MLSSTVICKVIKTLMLLLKCMWMQQVIPPEAETLVAINLWH